MKKSTVDKWQQGRAGWNYSPALQFWHRFALFTLADAMQLEIPCGPLRLGETWPAEMCRIPDEAILARDWFATSEPGVEVNGKREYVSFAECCHWLGLDVNAERVGILAAIDAHADFDTEEIWSRLEALAEAEVSDSVCEMPDYARVVRERDQVELIDNREPEKPKKPKPAKAKRAEVAPSMLVSDFEQFSLLQGAAA